MRLTREALQIEIWNMLPDSARKELAPVKESYIESMMADIDDYCENYKSNFMITIETRQNAKGSWWCNATIQGYDYSFEKSTPWDAQHEMRNQISKLDVSPDNVRWEPLSIYNHEPKEERGRYVGSEPFRIDRGMV